MYEDSFIDKLNEVIDQYAIDFVLPANDLMLLKCAQNRDKLHCEVITSSAEVCEIACSKRKTYEVLDGVVPVPKMYTLDTIPTYPVFLKPEVGHSGHGCLLAKTKEDVEYALKQDPSLLILENLPGKEYTVDCFTDFNGNLLYVNGRERERTLNGVSAHSFPVNRPEFEDYAKRISQKLQFDGMWFFQVKEDVKGQLVLMEIAPRCAGTMDLTRMLNVNLPLLSCFNACKFPVSIDPNPYYVEIDRALSSKYKLNLTYQTVYVDFDDCLIFRGKVNTKMLAFIYQCINDGKKVILISKHAKDLDESLRQFRLQNVFDEIIHIEKTDEKYKYIQDQNAIFIDDSFAERKRIFENCHIPVFSPDMIADLV